MHFVHVLRVRSYVPTLFQCAHFRFVSFSFTCVLSMKNTSWIVSAYASFISALSTPDPFCDLLKLIAVWFNCHSSFQLVCHVPFVLHNFMLQLFCDVLGKTFHVYRCDSRRAYPLISCVSSLVKLSTSVFRKCENVHCFWLPVKCTR